jgi:thiamine-monophosphate kinase
MLDVSDGLLRDLGRVARASGVAVDLDRAALVAAYLEPLRSVAERLAADPWQWLLGGGEDHPLAATFPPSAPLPTGFVRVGTVRAVRAVDDAEGAALSGGGALSGEAVRSEGLVLLDGAVPRLSRGWDHFGGA